MLQFEYTRIQLNQLPWRQFVKQPNPVASALMAKMEMAPSERPQVKLECLRLLATLKLDPARSELIGRFVNAYLKLTRAELQQYEREFDKLSPADREATMELMTSWKREGIKIGRQDGKQEGKQELVVRQIRRQIGTVAPQTLERLNFLSSDQLNDLGEALLDFTSVEDLEVWLSHVSPQ